MLRKMIPRLAVVTVAVFLSGCGMLNTTRVVRNIGTTYVITQPTGRYFTEQDGSYVIELSQYRAKDRIKWQFEDIHRPNLESISPVENVYIKEEQLPQRATDILPVDNLEIITLELPCNVEFSQCNIDYDWDYFSGSIYQKEYNALHYATVPLMVPAILFDITATLSLVPVAIL